MLIVSEDDGDIRADAVQGRGQVSDVALAGLIALLGLFGAELVLEVLMRGQGLALQALPQ